MAIAAILLGMALPAFNTFIDQRNMTARGNDFISAVNLARSEAVNRGALVSIQSRAVAGDNEWGGGYCVVVGTPGNCDDALREFEAAAPTTMNAMGAMNGVPTLTYNGRGLLTLGAQGTIEICRDGVNPGREIDINTVGRASSGELVCP